MPDADDTSRIETERKNDLFAWLDHLLDEVGLAARIAQAELRDLRAIVLDVEAAEIVLAIREALHPADGKPAEIFKELSAKSLKRLLASRFAKMKREREAELLAGHGAAPRPDPGDEEAPKNPADLVCTALGTYVELTVHQFVASLWILHTHIFDRFITGTMFVD
jgi:hypothetical protein